MKKSYSEKPESLSEEEIPVIEGLLERPLSNEEKAFYNSDDTLLLLGLTRRIQLPSIYSASLEPKKFLSQSNPRIPLEFLKKPDPDLELLKIIAKGIYSNEDMRFVFERKRLVFNSDSPSLVKTYYGRNIEREDLERLVKSNLRALLINFDMDPLKAIHLEDWQLKNLGNRDLQRLWRERYQEDPNKRTPDEIADLTPHQVELLTFVNKNGHIGYDFIEAGGLQFNDLHLLTKDDIETIMILFKGTITDHPSEIRGAFQYISSKKTIVSETGRNQPHIVHIGDILSVMNDHLVDGETTSAPPRPPGGIMQMLDEMIGRHNFTTDMGLALTTCAPFLERQFPQLKGIVCTNMSQEGRERWLAEQVDRFGEYFYVQPISEMELRHDWDSFEGAQKLAGDKLIQTYDIDGRG